MAQALPAALASLRDEFHPKSLLASLRAGGLLGLLEVFLAAPLASLIFAGSMEAYLPLDISLALLKATVVYFGIALVSSFPGMLGSVWDVSSVLLDLFNRFVVGWLIAQHEPAQLAQALIAERCARQHVPSSQLSLPSDRGGPMTTKPLALLLADLDVTHSPAQRPHTLDDNPYPQAQFKTVKYHPTFPERLGRVLDARTWG